MENTFTWVSVTGIDNIICSEIVSTVGLVITDVTNDTLTIKKQVTPDWIKKQQIQHVFDDYEGKKSPKQLKREIEKKNIEVERKKSQKINDVSTALHPIQFSCHGNKMLICYFIGRQNYMMLHVDLLVNFKFRIELNLIVCLHLRQ